jgi:transcriptional regulator with PAS, ATPase and Fis domain
MAVPDWTRELTVAITVCDKEGRILEMNEQSRQVFAKSGGGKLIGVSLLDCHPVQARQKLINLLETREVNCYTVDKDGVKKLIYQAPWYEGGEFGGYVELSMPLPQGLPNYVRQ